MINVDTDGVHLVTRSEVDPSCCWYRVFIKGDVADELTKLAAAYGCSESEMIEHLVNEAKEHG